MGCPRPSIRAAGVPPARTKLRDQGGDAERNRDDDGDDEIDREQGEPDHSVEERDRGSRAPRVCSVRARSMGQAPPARARSGPVNGMIDHQ
jgi:hypothetical protein